MKEGDTAATPLASSEFTDQIFDARPDASLDNLRRGGLEIAEFYPKEDTLTNRSENDRARAITGNTFMLVSAIAVPLSETLKFLHVHAVVHEMASAGFPGSKLMLVATLGSTSAVLFLYPRTRSIGLLLLSSFLGGAICVHVQQGKYAALPAPAILLAFAWIGTYLRHPKLFWSFGKQDTQTSQSGQTNWASREA